MPRKAHEPDRFLTLDDNLRVVAISNRRGQRKDVARRLLEPRPFIKRPPTETFAPLPSLLRNRGLLMAALRVWELRNGIHDGW